MSQFPVIDILPLAIPGPAGVPGTLRTGKATMSGGSVVGSDPQMTTNSRYLATSQANGVTGALRVIPNVGAKTITIKSSNGSDAGDVYWEGKEV